MNRTRISIRASRWIVSLATLACLALPLGAAAQDFDFADLEKKVSSFSVVVDLSYEVSFGIHSSQQQERYLGTVVSADGLIMFNGVSLDTEGSMGTVGSLSIRATPTRIDVSTMDGDTFDGEFLGIDTYTKLAFVQITNLADRELTPIEFKWRDDLEVGDWLALYTLLPEFIDPPFAADVGMVSALIETPEVFALTVGFSPLQMTSVLFDDNLQPIGVLGTLMDPQGGDVGFMEPMGSFDLPLLGVVSGERLERLIDNPPLKGETDRGWLGITLQALTTDMAEFWGLDLPGGIIVNDVVRNSPAEQAGLAVGDIIVSVNGIRLEIDRDENLSVFQRQIADLGSGAAVEFGIIRLGPTEPDTLTLLATLEKAPLAAGDAEELEIESLEFSVRDLVFGDYMRFNRDPDSLSGVVVSKLKQGGLGSVGGLSIGDVIQRVGNTGVSSVDEMNIVIEQIEDEKPKEVILFVWRDSKTMFVNVKTDWD